MFRPMRRCGQQLELNECIEILKAEPRGVLSLLGDNGYPYGIPMDHWYCEQDGKLYFHGAKMAIKLIPYRAVIRFPIVYMTKASVKKENGL